MGKKESGGKEVKNERKIEANDKGGVETNDLREKMVAVVAAVKGHSITL